MNSKMTQEPQITHFKSDRSRDFIDLIHKDHQQGYRFTFFIGAGLSRPAGYPLPLHLGQHYLPYCIMRSLGLDPLSEKPRRDRFPRWDPRSAGWPRMDEEIAERWSRPVKSGVIRKLPKVEQLTLYLTRWLGQSAQDQAAKEKAAKDKKAKDKTVQDTTPTKFEACYPELSKPLVAAALGAIQDWRSSLRFLCQLQMVDSKLQLVRSDFAVQDSMFQALLQLCDPGLGHRMVAALCTVMRCNCIVTTNFDDLIEKAFATVPLALSTFEVAQPAPMPGSTIVCSQRSLVKMNGGNFSLITNETLDAEPSQDDLDNFVGYLRGLSAKNEDALSAIIVTGVSGTERRTLALFRHAAEKLPNLHIYWIEFSYSEDDDRKLRHNLKFDRSIADTNRGERLLWRLAHKEHGLLLQQLFMRITHSLPSSGVVFPGLWRLPLPPIISRGDEESTSGLKKKISRAIEDFRMVVVLSKARESAIRRVSSQVAADSRKSVAWIDLDQVGYPWGLLLRIIQIAARMHGTAEAPPALDFHQWTDEMDDHARNQFIETMKHILRRYHVRLFDELVIFLNGLDRLASHAPFGAKADGDLSYLYTGKTLLLLWSCLHEIANDPTCGIKFVILGSLYKKTGGDDYADCNTNGLSLQAWLAGHPAHVKVVHETGPRPPLFVQKRIEAAEKWYHGDRLRIAFLYLVCSFRYSRHPVGISRVFGRYAERAKQETTKHYVEAFLDSEQWLGEWLKVSSDLPILREKLGGLLWMHPRIKEVLKERVRDAWRTASGSDYSYEILMMGNLMARHYGQLMLATADPLAGLEQVHHVLRSIEASMIGCPSFSFTSKSQKGQKAKGEIEALALHMIQHGIIALKLCRPLLDRRLASDFAEASLQGLDCQLKRLRKKLLNKAHPAILKRLHLLELEASMARGDVLLRSARSTSLFEWFQTVEVDPAKTESLASQTDVSQHLMHRHESRTLKQIGARILIRRHDEAQDELEQVWLQLAEKAVLRQEAPSMIQPLIDRLSGEGKDASTQMGDSLARQWLYRAWTADSPMTEAMMEHWRRYIVRASLWSTMLILNREQARNLVTENRSKEDFRAHLKEAIWIADFGLEILRNVDHSRDGVGVHEQVRLRCLIALCRAFAVDPPICTDNRDYLAPVMRSLNGLRDAAAWVEDFPFRDAELERAIIALRSAEVRLTVLWKVADFRYLRDLILRDPPDSTWFTRKQCEDFRRDFKDLDIVGLSANAEQILSLLESAEQILRAYPKSVWWIWVLWALKSRLSAFYFTLRAGDALSLTGTGTANVDMLMHVPNSLRTASRGGIFSAISMQGIHDPFRIARIIRSQHRVFAAEVFRRRLSQTPRSATLEQVLDDLDEGMTAALKILQKQIYRYQKSPADSNLIKYCQNVHDHAWSYAEQWKKARDHTAASSTT